MVSLGTHSVIERAELVTPRLTVRALNFYPDNCMSGLTSPLGVPPALPGRPSKFDSSGNEKLPLVSRSKHHEREFCDEVQEATAQRKGV